MTICAQNAKEILSQIVFSDAQYNVGRGLAPAAYSIVLTSVGVIAEKQLLELENRFPCVSIDKYVIMPNHIHVIIVIQKEAAGASPRPTLNSVVGVFKSLTTRICNENDKTPGRKLFQTSFYEHIIRNEEAYNDICRYIYDNPMKWYHQYKEEMTNGK